MPTEQNPVQVVILPMPKKDPGPQQGVDIPVFQHDQNAYKGISYGVDAEIQAHQSAYTSNVDPGSRVSEESLLKDAEAINAEGE